MHSISNVGVYIFPVISPIRATRLSKCLPLVLNSSMLSRYINVLSDYRSLDIYAMQGSRYLSGFR